MEWLRRGMRRNKESMLQAVGVHQGTEDEAFENKYNAFKSYIRELENVSESMQAYVEALEAYSAAMVCMGRAFKTLHSGNNCITGAVRFLIPSKMGTVCGDVL